YEDAIAHDPRIDALRAKMEVKENTVFTREYYERDKRHIGNALHVFFNDGSPRLELRVDFPIGHRKRRAEGMPVLVKKFQDSVRAHFPARQSEAIEALFARRDFESLAVNEFMAALVAN
ncbi:MAG TPA: 2-methylcitrate dehydratase, partial [Steroidobacteraceae bacterium]